MTRWRWAHHTPGRTLGGASSEAALRIICKSKGYQGRNCITLRLKRNISLLPQNAQERRAQQNSPQVGKFMRGRHAGIQAQRHRRLTGRRGQGTARHGGGDAWESQHLPREPRGRAKLHVPFFTSASFTLALFCLSYFYTRPTALLPSAWISTSSSTPT